MTHKYFFIWLQVARQGLQAKRFLVQERHCTSHLTYVYVRWRWAGVKRGVSHFERLFLEKMGGWWRKTRRIGEL